MFNTIIKNGTIIDGTGRKRYKGDIGIKNGLITAIDNLHGASADRTINADKMFITPGFIDVLNHSDSYLSIFKTPSLASLTTQGVTSIIMGNCGSSFAPLSSNITSKSVLKWPKLFSRSNLIFYPNLSSTILDSMQKWGNTSGINLNWSSVSEFMNEISKRGLGTNFGTLAGHSTIRRILTGNISRELNHKEIKYLNNIVGESLEHGALGLSISLDHSHSQKISEDELNSLSETISNKNSLLAFHLRNESENLLPSIKEVLKHTSKNKTPFQISHLKIEGKKNWSNKESLIKTLEKADKKGYEVNWDLYPYTYTWKNLSHLLPQWAYHGTEDKLIKRLGDKKTNKKIIKELDEKNLNYNEIIITSSSLKKSIIGQSISSLGKKLDKEPSQILVDLIKLSKTHLFGITKSISSEIMTDLISHPLSIISSCGAGYDLHSSKKETLVHPRCFGTFPKFIHKYVVEKKKITLEKAIQKITGMPALKYNLKGRGFLETNTKADITIINPSQIKDNSTYKNPYQYSSGIPYVLVNGKLVVDNNKVQDTLPGEPL